LKPVYVIGHLHALWHDALEQQEDGDLSKWSDGLIAESSQYDGDAPQYVSLLQQYGWLDNRLIHDWLEYAGRYLEGKYRTSNIEMLKAIWKKHGLNYMEPYRRKKVVGLKTDFSQTLVSPDKTILPDLRLPEIKEPTPTSKPPSKPQKFSKPTPQEASEYAKSIGYRLDGEAFCAHYDARGWKYGQGNPMKDWKAAIVTWKKRAEPSQLIQAPKPVKPRIPDNELTESDRADILAEIANAKESLKQKEAV
jgi:hypothetical protein